MIINKDGIKIVHRDDKGFKRSNLVDSESWEAVAKQDKCATPGEVVDNVGAIHTQGKGKMGNVGLPLNFAVNPKLLFKKVYLFKFKKTTKTNITTILTF